MNYLHFTKNCFIKCCYKQRRNRLRKERHKLVIHNSITYLITLWLSMKPKCESLFIVVVISFHIIIFCLAVHNQRKNMVIDMVLCPSFNNLLTHTMKSFFAYPFDHFFSGEFIIDILPFCIFTILSYFTLEKVWLDSFCLRCYKIKIFQVILDWDYNIIRLEFNGNCSDIDILIFLVIQLLKESFYSITYMLWKALLQFHPHHIHFHS